MKEPGEYALKGRRSLALLISTLKEKRILSCSMILKLEKKHPEKTNAQQRRKRAETDLEQDSQRKASGNSCSLQMKEKILPSPTKHWRRR